MQDLINKIHHADCLEFMKQLPDKCIDLVLTDPPYGIGAGDIKFANHKTKNLNKFNIYKNNDWDILPSKDVFEQIFRVSKNQIIWGGNYFVENICNSKCWIVWDKKTGENTSISAARWASPGLRSMSQRMVPKVCITRWSSTTMRSFST